MAAKQGFPKEIVLVAGERVALNPTGLTPGDPMGVDFTTYYKPEDMSDIEASLVKKTFQELFGGTSLPVFDTSLQKDLDKSTTMGFLPPCDPAQKALVLKSLEFRMAKLRQELGAKGVLSARDIAKKLEKESVIGSVEPKDTATLRDMFRHYQKLKALIDNYNVGQKCVSMSDKAFGELQFDLTDDRAKELLRQFIFFTLQSHHPLQEYKNTNPTAPQFIKRLEVNPLGKPKFQSFLTTYEGNKLPIPESIARVLESVEGKSGVLDTQVKERLAQAIQSEKDKILALLRRFFPDGDRFWSKVGKDNDVYKIVDTLLEYMNVAKGDVENLTKETIQLKDKIRRCEENNRLLTENYSRIEAQVRDLTARLEAEGGKDKTIADLQAALARARAEHEGDIRENEEAIRGYAERIENNAAQIAALTARNAQLEARLRELEPQLAALQNIEQRKNAELEDLRQQHATNLAAEQARTATETRAKEAAEGQRTEAVAALQAVRTDLQRSEALLTAKDAELASLRETVDRLTREKRDCETEKESLESRLAAETAELNSLRREKQQLLNQIAEKEDALVAAREKAETDAETARQEIERLTRENAALQAALAEANAALKACEARIPALEAQASEPQKRIAALEGELRAAEERRAAAEQEKQRLLAENQRLRDEISAKDAALTKSGEDLAAAKAQTVEAEGRLSTAEARVGTLEGDVAKLQGEVEAKTEELDAESAGRREDAGKHVKAIDDLTSEFAGKLDEKTREAQAKSDALDAESRRHAAEREALEAKVVKSNEAYEKLQAAIEALLTGPETKVNETIAAATEAGDQTQGSLQTIYRKLQDFERLAAEKDASPMTAEECSAEQRANRCYNVFLTTYLWQTYFPADKPANSTNLFFKKIYGLFVGVKEEKVEGTLKAVKGIYTEVKDTSKGTKFIAKDILPSLFKFLQIFLYYFPPDPAVNRYPTFTKEDSKIYELLLRNINQMDVVYKPPTGSLSIVEPFREEARKYLLTMPPYNNNAPIPPGGIVMTSDLAADKYSVKVEESDPKLTFPILFYCFLLAMRDYLNDNSGTLSSNGCPLPKVLRKA